MKQRAKLWRGFILWGIASFLSLVGPLATVLIINRDRYFTTVHDAVRLTIGGALCVIFLLVLIFGKMKAPSSIFVFAFVYLLACLLEPIFKDLKLLSGVALCGKVVDWIFFTPRLRHCREQLRMHEQADVTAKAMVAALKQHHEGRV